MTTFDLEKTLAGLIGMPTTTHNLATNDAAIEFLSTFFAARNLHVTRFTFEGHSALVATTKPGTKTPEIMLYAHIDVVPGDNELFTLKPDGDKLYGRGTFDMKFAIAAYMQLVDELQAKMDQYDLGIMITSDEELGSVDGVNSVKQLVALGYRPKVVLMPDGGDNWDLENLAKGYWHFNVTAKGRTAHGSRPWEGDSASFKLVRALHDIRSLFTNDPTGSTINIGVIQGGTALNQVPDLMTGSVDVRLISRASYKQLEKAIHDICTAHDVSIETRSLGMPYKPNLANTYAKTFQQSVMAIIGKTSGSCISHGQSDAVYFAAVDIPCIITRPPGGALHSTGEWVSRQGLQQFPLVISHWLESLAKKQ